MLHLTKSKSQEKKYGSRADLAKEAALSALTSADCVTDRPGTLPRWITWTHYFGRGIQVDLWKRVPLSSVCWFQFKPNHSTEVGFCFFGFGARLFW
jgi:hypothetical protein